MTFYLNIAMNTSILHIKIYWAWRDTGGHIVAYNEYLLHLSSATYGPQNKRVGFYSASSMEQALCAR